MNPINLGLGAALLILGRRLFWLFVGVLGFVVGTQVAGQFFQTSPWLVTFLAVICGVLAALLAIALKKAAVILAGFLGGGYLVFLLLDILPLEPGAFTWVLVLAGGLIGAALLARVFEWSLIILSSLVGASMITSALPVSMQIGTIIFLVLLTAGILIQASGLLKGKH
jgi:hypothetical protein